MSLYIYIYVRLTAEFNCVAEFEARSQAHSLLRGLIKSSLTPTVRCTPHSFRVLISDCTHSTGAAMFAVRPESRREKYIMYKYESM